MLCISFSNVGAQAFIQQDINYEIGCTDAIHVDGDNMYAALGDNTFQVFENNQWSEPIKLSDESESTADITTDDEGVIWCVSDSGLFSYDNGTIEHFTTSNSDLPTNDLKAVHSADGVLWIVADINNVIKKTR